jgi:hypothetical protein
MKTDYDLIKEYVENDLTGEQEWWKSNGEKYVEHGQFLLDKDVELETVKEILNGLYWEAVQDFGV